MEVSVSHAAWTDFQTNGQTRRQTMVYFYDREVQNTFKTEQAGRPIFDMITFIKKIPPGDKLVEIDRKATKHDYMRYPREYEMYQKKQAVPIEGTSLEMWPQLTRTQVAELKALNIFTVEQLASLPDGYGHNIMGFQGWKQKAQAFIRAAAGQVEFEKMEALLKQRDEENETLRNQVLEALEGNKALMQAMTALQKDMADLAGKRKPGRPKRTDASP